MQVLNVYVMYYVYVCAFALQQHLIDVWGEVYWEGSEVCLLCSAAPVFIMLDI